jgi:hypothetical protein
MILGQPAAVSETQNYQKAGVSPTRRSYERRATMGAGQAFQLAIV